MAWILGILVFVALSYVFYRTPKHSHYGSGKSLVESPKSIALCGENKIEHVSMKFIGFWSVRWSDKEAHNFLDSFKGIEPIQGLVTYLLVVALGTAVYRYHVVNMLGYGQEALGDMKQGESDAINTFKLANGDKVSSDTCDAFSKWVDYFHHALCKEFEEIEDKKNTYHISELTKALIAAIEKYNPGLSVIEPMDRVLIDAFLMSSVTAKLNYLPSVLRNNL